jgi:outer membrane biogenesis lipoprotein LolB
MTKKIKKSLLLASTLLLLLGCSTDEKQTVTTMKQLVWQDEFNVDGAPDNLSLIHI